jgi:hypothetical protein
MLTLDQTKIHSTMQEHETKIANNFPLFSCGTYKCSSRKINYESHIRNNPRFEERKHTPKTIVTNLNQVRKVHDIFC